MKLMLLCLKIYFARILDVSMGTIRTIYTVKGKTIISGIIAFFEVAIWFIIVREALNTELNSIWIMIFYAGGYATGTIIGTFISKKFINSLISVEVITSKATKKNLDYIRKEGFGVSVVDTTDSYEDSKKNILFITINSRYLEKLKKIINKIDKQAFMVINESKVVHNGYIK